MECDSVGLSSIQIQDLKTAFLVTDDNPLVGVEGRCRLLQSLGKVLEANPKFFLYDGVSRPGNLIYYLINHPDTVKSGEMYETSIDTLWTVVIDGFAGVWPETRTIVDGVSLGDVWPCKAMLSIEKDLGLPSSGLVCFHKLSQWLTYSLMEPLLGHIKFTSKSKLTGLAEYRNGGLFIDYGVLVPKVPFQPPYNVYDDLVVEWRALTVALLDLVGQQVRLKLGKTEEEFPLVVCLEAGTWKAGREIAKKLRSGMGPPFAIISDGTVF